MIMLLIYKNDINEFIYTILRMNLSAQEVADHIV